MHQGNNKVVVDVFMTDQGASGPYMVESVKALPKGVLENVELHIWNVKTLEGIKKKKELGARVVPAIAIDEDVVFQSGIPQEDELVGAILERRSKNPSGRTKCKSNKGIYIIL